jgi:hypothetical protein
MQPHPTPSAHVCTPPAARQITQAEADLLERYTSTQTNAFLQLFRLAQRHPGTGGGDTAAMVLLGLYNGPRFPLDLTELRRLDAGNLNAAITAIATDAGHCCAEVHEVLNALLGRTSVGHELEIWAYDLRLPKRCKAAELSELRRLVATDEGGAA